MVAAAAVAALPVASGGHAVALTALVAALVARRVRVGGLGIGGADHMFLVVCGASWLATVVAGDRRAAEAGLWFIAAQACLAYLVAGVTKLASPTWRSGRALHLVAATRSHGCLALRRCLAAAPWLARPACWGVMVWECAFPLVLLAPEPARLAILASGVLMHVALALVMGLNTFVWAFPATYPAVWWAAQL
jgi:hypothetical protein